MVARVKLKYDSKKWSGFSDFDNDGYLWSSEFKAFIQNVFETTDFESVLDIGCCTGHCVQKLRELGYEGDYLGVDITPEYVERAQNLHSEESFCIDDAHSLGTVDKRYDLVLLLGVIMHLDEYSKAIEAAFRVAKKYVLIMSWGVPDGVESSVRMPFGGFIERRLSKNDILKHVPDYYVLVEEHFSSDDGIDRWCFLFQNEDYVQVDDSLEIGRSMSYPVEEVNDTEEPENDVEDELNEESGPADSGEIEEAAAEEVNDVADEVKEEVEENYDEEEDDEYEDDEEFELDRDSMISRIAMEVVDNDGPEDDDEDIT